jgi:hypothetical protein
MRRVLFQGTPMKKTHIAPSVPPVVLEMTPQLVLQQADEAEEEPLMGFLFHCRPLVLCEETLPTGTNILPKPFEQDALLPGRMDPIRWWRALQLFEAIPVVNEHLLPLKLLLSDLFLATRRHEPGSYVQKVTASARNTLSPDQSYDEIMRRPVPIEIINMLVQLAEEEYDMTSALHCVSDEIAAGTICWSQALERIGVKHPDWWQAWREERARISERYAPYLVSYAAWQGHHYQPGIEKKKSVELHVIEQCLSDVVERGIEQQYGEGITVMLAIAREKIETDNLLEHLERQQLASKEAIGQPHQPILRPEPQQRLQEITAWFVKHHTQEARTPDEVQARQRKYLETLEQLYARWDHLPIMYLLGSSGHAAQADGDSGTDQQRAITSGIEGEE